MDKNTERLSLTAGMLTTPQGADAWFEIFVLENSLHFEISEARHHDERDRVTSEQDWATYTFTAPVFLLKDAKSRGYRLPDISVQAMERFTQSGGRVIEAMVVSIKAEMQAMARNSKRESAWCDHPERLIWRLVKVHVPADIQLAVFALLKEYRHHFSEDGTVVVKREENT